ncbi:hypothetical protein UDX32_19240 [Serratia marcescens]|uniref:hypothetical protein n=1 Tax=Serratia TaxID=613 RepID=UPI00093DBAC5|nr:MULTISPECIES: hypothetical protein [Serratia]MBH2855220.1 hypothetical protein [Serratia marcescens]MDB6450199.1 hypothetical protein [Serratia sp. 21NM0010]HAT2878018.1 hypothetical protein [Serratia marcescens]HAT2889341.1 hypothetical protein [Serratia marcescens]HAT2894906.1 hypothetical protein [Serratia marcescens]
MAILLLCTAIALLQVQMRHNSAPEACATVLRTFITVDQRPTRGVILVNTVPGSLGTLKVLLSGKLQEGDETYTIARELRVKYTNKDEYHPMIVDKSIQKDRDTVSQAHLDKIFPGEGQYLHIKINRLDENTYAYSDNYSPIFVCTTQ